MTPHLVFCWELGQGYGHILRFKDLAEHLLQQNWQITCIVKDATVASQLLPSPCQIHTAPVRKYKAVYNPTTNLAQIIINNGFFDDFWLQQSVDDWQQRFQALRPDLVLLDHAPTALLAAFRRNIKTGLIGTGFTDPPDEYPLPNFDSMTEEVHGEAEKLLVERVNRLLPDAKKLTGLAQLYQSAKLRFLCTLPELDHYPDRREAEYWGPNFDLLQGDAPMWPLRSNRKLFAYLHRDYNRLEELLAALNRLDASVVASISRIDPGWPAKFQNIHLHRGPVELQQVTNEADLVLCHAGHGTVAGMLMAGMPMLLVPKQLEQSLLANRLCRQHLAYFLTPDSDFTQLADYIETILADNRLGHQLTLFKQRYHGFCRQEQLEAMADDLQSLLDLPPLSSIAEGQTCQSHSDE